jgi:AmmeMemoRadiSam system protein B
MDFMQALAATAREADGKTVYIGAVDLAHVGVQFGGDAVNFATLQSIARHDAALIDLIMAGDAEAFMQAIRSDGNANNVCGAAAIYAVMRLTGGATGSRLDYQQWTDGHSTVTFAAVSFLEEPRPILRRKPDPQ